MATQEKSPWWLMKNSRGQKDAMWTLTFISFVVTTVAYIGSLFESIQVGDVAVTFRPFDGLGYAAVVLVPLLGAYFGRRYTQEAQETSVAKAQIYAEVAKRRIDGPKSKQDQTNAAAQEVSDIEIASEEEFSDPKDEV